MKLEPFTIILLTVTVTSFHPANANSESNKQFEIDQVHMLMFF